LWEGKDETRDATSDNRVICHDEKIERRAGQGSRARSVAEGEEEEDRRGQCREEE